MRPRFSEPNVSRHLASLRLPAPLMALFVAAAGLLLPGCVYRMTIQQGNFLEERAVTQLQVGMTRSQVRYLLGTPMVPDAFDKDRWDYLYYLKIGRLRTPHQRHLVVYFQDEKVSRVDNQDSRPMPPAEQRQTEPGVATPPTATVPPPSTT